MTREQREDLLIEWELTSSKVKMTIEKEYVRRYGDVLSDKDWQEYLIEALNLRQSWQGRGLA